MATGTKFPVACVDTGAFDVGEVNVPSIKRAETRVVAVENMSVSVFA